MHGDPAARGLECRLGLGQAATRLRGDEHLRVTGCEWSEAAHDPVHPVGDRAERIVVEGGHLSGVYRAVREHRIPSFPDSGRAHGYRVEPGRALALEEELVRLVSVAGLGERVSDERGSGEPGGDTVAGLCAQFCEPVTCQGLVGRVQQAERDREGVDRGAVAEDAASGDVVLVDRRTEAGREVRELGVLCWPAEDLGRVGCDDRGPEGARGCDDTGVSLGPGRVLRRGIGIEPVAELEAGLPYSVL